MSAILVSQNLLEPNDYDADRKSVDLEVSDADLKNGHASDRVPVPMLRIALQGFYIFLGPFTEAAAELADLVPDDTDQILKGLGERMAA